MIRKLADKRLSLADLREAGFDFRAPFGKARARARQILRNARKVLGNRIAGIRKRA